MLATLLDAIVIRIGLDCGTNLPLIQISNQNREKNMNIRPKRAKVFK
jgi:hypothetical protein